MPYISQICFADERLKILNTNAITIRDAARNAVDDLPFALIMHQYAAMRHTLGRGEGLGDQGGDEGIALPEQDVAFSEACAIHKGTVPFQTIRLPRESSATKGRAC